MDNGHGFMNKDLFKFFHYFISQILTQENANSLYIGNDSWFKLIMLTPIDIILHIN